jgi:crotonobetainyl-CoA:carnitine CoA-transferase CaiB-like acyl-CoA transferase
MGDPEWAADEFFSDAYSRWENRAKLDKLISEWTINYTPYEAMVLLQEAGVAAIPSFNAEEILSDPHVISRSLFTEVEHPALGKQVVMKPAWRFSETPARVRKAAPLLGEDNEEIFGTLLEMPKEEIEKLLEEKVIY